MATTDTAMVEHRQSTPPTPSPTPGPGGLGHARRSTSLSKIPRKPVAPSHFDSNTTLREEQGDEGGADTPTPTPPRNPLAKTVIKIMPAVVRPCTDTSVGSETTTAPPLRIHASVSARLAERRKRREPEGERTKVQEGVALARDLGAGWGIDLVWIGVSLLCFIILVAVLSAFDGRALADLPAAMGGTLSAFIAIFTTFATTALMIPVAGAISQCGWNWFSKDSPLSDFKLFDDASRNIVGAVELMRRLSYKHFASLGGLVAAATIFTVPLTQLLVAYPERYIPITSANAVVPSVRTLQESRLTSLGPSDLQMAASRGVLDYPDVRPLEPTCSASDCQFPRFQSLGICAKVADISHLLNITAAGNSSSSSAAGSFSRPLASGNQTAYLATLPRQANCFIRTPWSFAVAACKTNGTTSLAFADDAALGPAIISSMPIIYANTNNGTDDSTFQAVEVLFHLCVGSYDARVERGIPKTEVTEHPPVVASGSTAQAADVACGVPTGEADLGCRAGDDVPFNAYVELRDSEGGPNAAQNFKAELRSVRALALALQKAVSGLWEWDGRPSGSLGQPIVNVVGGPEMQALASAIYGPFDYDSGKQMERITGVMRGLTLSMNNAIRSRKTDSQGSIPESIRGTALARTPAVKVRWGWIILLVLQFTIGTGFVITTAYMTHRLQAGDYGGEVVKSSALAFLFALGDECRAVAGGLESAGGMLRKARVLQVVRRGEHIEMVGARVRGAVTPVSERARTPMSRGSPTEKAESRVVEDKI